MDNIILEKIVKEGHKDELNRFNSVKIINDLFSRLMDRERDVLTRRFGLGGKRGETLEKIGQLHNLTRERVRQIEAASIRKLKRLDDLESYVDALRSIIIDLLNSHGGLLRKDFLLDILTVMTLELAGNANDPEKYQADRLIYKNNFDFLLSRILSDDFEFINKSQQFNPSIKTKDMSMDHFEALANDLLAKIDVLKKTLSTEELVDLLKKLDTYNNYQEKLQPATMIDIFPIFKSKIFPDKAEIINSNKVLYSLMQAIKNLERNKYGYWGMADWQEIKPKNINDKIYLVLKNQGSPLHFTEIATKINEIQFDHKKANPATVHNELILDDRYILTGRGMYGLKEWQV